MNDKLDLTVEILKNWEIKSKQTLSNGTIQICHVPHIGREAWLHILYAGLSEKQIIELQQSIPVALPIPYVEFLKSYNGINIFSNSLSVWGLRSLNYRTGEESIQPYSFLDPNKLRSRNIPDTWLFIGDYPWDGSRVVIDLDEGSNFNKIYRCNWQDVEILNEWPDFWSWLLSETKRLTKMFDENGIALDDDAPTTPN